MTLALSLLVEKRYFGLRSGQSAVVEKDSPAKGFDDVLLRRKECTNLTPTWKDYWSRGRVPARHDCFGTSISDLLAQKNRRSGARVVVLRM